jgi:hypothetical protein
VAAYDGPCGVDHLRPNGGSAVHDNTARSRTRRFSLIPLGKKHGRAFAVPAAMTRISTLVLLAVLGVPIAAAAQSNSTAAGAAVAQAITCVSTDVAKVTCVADTSGSVILVKSIGTGECLEGRTWGHDEKGIWVSYGCGGEFTVGQAAATTVPPTAAQTPSAPTPAVESWGEFSPGQGFLVGRSSAGELAISAYALIRYLDQTPATDTFVDHLGNERPVDGRNDIFPHRVIIWFKGWLGRPQLVYNIAVWTVNTTNQVALFGNLGYQFSRKLSIYGGINGNPGTRSLQGSHPYWLGHDRVMADEFFRPYFGSGVWVQGEAVGGLWYNVMLGNSNSALDIKATQLDRSFTPSASVWWMPTTKEFGPKGGYGDWEGHEKLATRFGMSASSSTEQRYTNADNGSSGNTTLRLADSINVFDTGALANGVTVELVDFTILSFDAGIKYKGLFLQTEIYNRWHPCTIGASTCRARSIQYRKNSSSTPSRRRFSATRTPASRIAPSTAAA